MSLTTTKVLIVDDNEFNREGMHLYLSQRGFSVFEAGDAESAQEIVRSEAPHVTVLDIVIPRTRHERAKLSESLGICLVSHLKELQPTMGIVLFSAYENRGSAVFDIMRAGVRGIAYKLKGCSPDVLLRAIEEVMAGRMVIDAEVTTKRTLAHELQAQLRAEERPWVLHAVQQISQLTPREREVMQRLAAAHTTEGIAEALTLSPKTIENYTGRVYDKLGLRTISEETPRLRKAILLAKACMIYELQHGGS